MNVYETTVLKYYSKVYNRFAYFINEVRGQLIKICIIIIIITDLCVYYNKLSVLARRKENHVFHAKEMRLMV